MTVGDILGEVYAEAMQEQHERERVFVVGLRVAAKARRHGMGAEHLRRWLEEACIPEETAGVVVRLAYGAESSSNAGS